MKHTRRGLFQMIGAAIAGRRCARALAGYVTHELKVGDYFSISRRPPMWIQVCNPMPASAQWLLQAYMNRQHSQAIEMLLWKREKDQAA